MKKKVLIFLLALLFALTALMLYACKDKEENEDVQSDKQEVESKSGETGDDKNTDNIEQKDNKSGTQSDAQNENEQESNKQPSNPTSTKTEETLSSSMSKSIYSHSFETLKSTTNIKGIYSATFRVNDIEDKKFIGVYTKTGETDDTIINGEIGLPDGSYINIETIEKKNGGYIWTNRTKYRDTTEFKTQEKQISYIEWLNALENHNVLWFFYDDIMTEGIPDMLEMEQGIETIKGKKITENDKTSYIININHKEIDSNFFEEDSFTIIIENEKIISIEFQTKTIDEGDEVYQTNGTLQIQYDFLG